MLTSTQLSTLHGHLAERLPNWTGKLVPLSDTGLAHDHIRITETPYLLRIPKQSQLNLPPLENLHYQAACFQRAQGGEHTPKFFALIEPEDELPLGALIVEFIEGQTAQLPQDLEPIATALASLHRLPLPTTAERAPLINPIEGRQAALNEIAWHMHFARKADLTLATRRLIDQEWHELKQATLPEETPCLIAFDTHPGNFLMKSSRAYLVDLEKMRYGAPGADLAHATIYTSTTWDLNSHSVLTPDEVASFYRRWLGQMKLDFMPVNLMYWRRVMTLWALSWCIKWKVQSQQPRRVASTENWSAQLSEQQLINHVADRVEHYLEAATIERIFSEWRQRNELTDLLDPKPHFLEI